MYVNAKKIAFLGLLLAFAVILVIFSGIFEFNTLFLLAAASFCVGIAIRECKMALGFGFFIASTLLSLMLAPNKLYCITYSAFGLYIVIAEYTWGKLEKGKIRKNRSELLWIIKYIVFNLMFIPMVLFFPKLFYQGSINPGLIAVFLFGGQIALFIFDNAYRYFQRSIWGKVRHHFQL
ncbi:MAG: hypothetical protein K0S47_206 [Herbinix sp.]|jgi:hypothetical protein|nr:hypothetical protein [Herbinix sp.]